MGNSFCVVTATMVYACLLSDHYRKGVYGVVLRAPLAFGFSVSNNLSIFMKKKKERESFMCSLVSQ